MSFPPLGGTAIQPRDQWGRTKVIGTGAGPQFPPTDAPPQETAFRATQPWSATQGSFGGSAGTNGVAQQDPAAMYASLFGTATPEARVTNGWPAAGPITPPGEIPADSRHVPGGVPPNGGGADKTPKPPKSTPAQAGANNSMMPGWSNGNPAVGYSGSEHGYSPPTGGGGPALPTRPATDPLNAAASMPPPPPPPRASLPPTPPQGMEQQAPLVGDATRNPAPPPVTATPDILPKFPPVAAPLSTDMPVTTREPDAQPGVIAAAGDVAGGGREPDAPGAAPAGQPKSAEATSATHTINWNGQTYSTTKPKPAAWATMTAAQRFKWLQANGADIGVQHSTQSDLNKFANTKNITLPAQALAQTAYITPTLLHGSPDAIKDAVGGDTSLTQLVGRYKILADRIESAGKHGAVAHPSDVKLWQDEKDAIEGALGNYNVKFGTAPATGDGGTGGGSTDGGSQDNTSDSINDNAADSGPHGNETSDGADQPGTNFDLSNLGPGDMKGLLSTLNELYKKDPAHATAIFEALFSASEQANKQNNTQSAVDVLSGAGSAFEKDPLNTGSRELSLDILKNPDPTNWGAIRNQTATDAARNAQAQIRALGSAAARRGVGAGVSGMASDVLRASDSDLARRMGELTIEESQGKRTAEMNAINNALRTLGGTSGVSLGNVSNIANILTGNSANDTNPFSGIAASFQNIDAAKAAAEAADKAGQFGWSDALKLIGGVAGTVLGGPAGGVIASSVLGGAGKAA